MNMLSCKNLTIVYDHHIAVEDLSFDVEQGDYICIVGQNGSGKSSLMKAIVGLHNPRSGSVVFSDTINKNRIGYLPQQNNIQKDFPASVYEVVLSGCANLHGFNPFYSKKDKVLALENMERLAISDLKKKSFSELSGGQQQRVLLARALCATDKILLLDEPVTGLDPHVSGDLYQLIRKLNKDLGVTILMVTHDIGASTKYADKILHINQKLLFYGTSADYLASDLGQDFSGHTHEEHNDV